jgi:transcriptional regulator with XRE-family HTH domain
MAWEKAPKGRSYPCNGDLVRRRRQQRRWTQEDLADITNYSVRLIAKAEAGGALHPDTLERLAAALSVPSDPLFPEDLITNPKQLALEFLKQLKLHRGQVVSKCQHFLAPEIRFNMPGNPDVFPFAGRHLGIDAMDRACQKFFETIEIVRPDLWRTEFAVCEGNEVVTGQWIYAQLRGLADQGIVTADRTLVVNRMIFVRGQIASFDDHYPHEETEKAVIEQQKRLRAVG